MIEFFTAMAATALALGLIAWVFYAGIVIGRALAPDPECPRKHRDDA
jgi:hypothetical protein